MASFVLCVFRRVEDHHNLQHYSPRLKSACVRQVVLDNLILPGNSNSNNNNRNNVSTGNRSNSNNSSSNTNMSIMIILRLGPRSLSGIYRLSSLENRFNGESY